MKQRITALLMVCILALSMPAHIFAAQSLSTTISALYKQPDIQVDVHMSPTSGNLIINPNGFPVKVEGKVESAQIINTPWSIENRSEVAIAVDAKVSAKIADGSTMELSERSVPQRRLSDKLAFMFLDMKVTDPGIDPNNLNWAETVYNRREQIVITEDGEEREKIMKLAAVDENGNTAAGGVGAFRIQGNASRDPEEPWDPDTDKVTINVALTFRPTVP